MTTNRLSLLHLQVIEKFENAIDILMKRKQELVEELQLLELKLEESDKIQQHDISFSFDQSMLQGIRHLGRLVIKRKSAVMPIIEIPIPAKPYFINKHKVDDKPSGVIALTDDQDKSLTYIDPDNSIKHFGFTLPSADAVIGGMSSSNGKIYISLMNKDQIQVLDQNGATIQSIGTHGRGKDELMGPSDLCVDGEFLFVCERDNSRIQIFKNSKHFQFIGWYDNKIGVLRKPRSIALNNVNNEREIIVLHSGPTAIQIYKITGEPISCFTTHYEGHGELLDSSRVRVSENGNIVVCGGASKYLYYYSKNKNICFVHGNEHNRSFSNVWDMCTLEGLNQVGLVDPDNKSFKIYKCEDLIIF